MDADTRAREIRYLAANPLLVDVFEKIEHDAYEELLSMPGWQRILRPAKQRALIERIKVIRDVRSRLAFLGTTQTNRRSIGVA